MGKKIVTSIRIDEEVLLKAKRIGLNISKIAENSVADIIKRIESGV